MLLSMTFSFSKGSSLTAATFAFCKLVLVLVLVLAFTNAPASVSSVFATKLRATCIGDNRNRLWGHFRKRDFYLVH